MKPVYIIAEIGINHNGKIDLAKKMIDASVESGADAVKFQKRDIQSVYSEEFLNSRRESPWGATQRDQKKGLEFGKKEYSIIDSYCKELKIDCVIYFSVDDEILLERIRSRISETPPDQRRKDDNEKTLGHRLKVYNKQTAPLLPFYEKHGALKTVDGMLPVEEVSLKLVDILRSKKAE